jgi:dihydroxy-acid dehydratase
MHGDGTLRSSKWFDGADIQTYSHRGWLRHNGFSDEALRGRPVIGICNMWSELVGCNVHLQGLATAVKRGVLQAGGLPLEFPVMTPGDALQKPAAMMYRNLASMDVEETIRSNPLDAVVLLAACDKSVPAAVMGATSADVPFLMVTGGPAQPGYWRGTKYGSGEGYWKFADMARTGEITAEEYREAEAATNRTHGHCMDMGTASTMASMCEALGLTLPGAAAVPAVDVRRAVLAERSGARAVDMARADDPRPSSILTADAFHNAICVLEALGGSTNALIHLIAIAGRVGIRLTLDDFQAAAHVPVLANVQPTGEHLMEDFFFAGGVPALMRELLPLLRGDALCVNGHRVHENVAGAAIADLDIIRPLATPLLAESAHAVLRGSLAPLGAVVKRSAASPHLLRHRGPAVVFEDVHDLNARIDDPDLDVTPDSVLVLRNGGPVGAPGFPEFGTLPVPQKLLRKGVKDVVRVSDSRISGTSFGTLVVHVAPEAAVGGPIGLVRSGDPIVLDAAANRLDLDIEPSDLERRRAEHRPPEPAYLRGYGALFLDHVLQADQGADFDFLQAFDGRRSDREPPLLLRGWASL